MANNSFVPEMSTNSIWVGENIELCLTDKLDAMETSTNGKANATHTHTASEITGLPSSVDAYSKSEVDNLLSAKAASNHSHDNASASVAGFMSAADKSKLDGIASGANAYSLPAATSSVLGGVKTGSNITNSNGTISLTKANVTSALGYTPPTTNTTYSNATTSVAGLMSASDKSKLDGIATGANKTTVDSALSATSTNPVQNKVIKSALDGKAASSHTHDYAATNHTHSYLPLAGGELTGNLDVEGGILRVKGDQSIFNNGSRIAFGSGDRETYALGTKLYCNQAWSVASDERLKENVAKVDVDKCAEFIKNMDVKTFNYIGNEAPCIGVIAQDVEASELGEYFVSEGEDGYLAVKASDLVFPLIATVQKLQKEIEELKNK